MSTRPLIKESLFLLNFYGIDPYRFNISSKIRVALLFTFFLVIFLNTVLDLIFNWRGLDSMETLVIVTSLLQILTKFCILGKNRDNFIHVINKMKKFWSIKKYGTEIKNEIENLHEFVKKIMKFVIGFIFFGMFSFFGATIFYPIKKLAFPMYFPTDLNISPDYEIAFGLEMLTSFFAAFFLVGFDFLFVSLIINFICELKIIKMGIRKIPINFKIKGDTPESLKEVYEIIEHHNLILGCIKSIRRVYSFWLLNIYFYNMIEMCVGMLSIIATGFPPSFGSLFQYGYATVFFMLQLFFYCVTGQYLITESESVSSIVYEIDWWIKTQPKLRRALVLVIQRANKPENLTAGGMFALNLQSFRKVTRSALSFFTLVNAVYEDVQ